MYLPTQPSNPEVFDGLIKDMVKYANIHNLLSSYRSQYHVWYHTLNAYHAFHQFNVQQFQRQYKLRKASSGTSQLPLETPSDGPIDALGSAHLPFHQQPLQSPLSYSNISNILLSGNADGIGASIDCAGSAIATPPHLHTASLTANLIQQPELVPTKSHLCLYGTGCKSTLLLDFLDTVCIDGPGMLSCVPLLHLFLETSKPTPFPCSCLMNNHHILPIVYNVHSFLLPTPPAYPLITMILYSTTPQHTHIPTYSSLFRLIVEPLTRH